MSAKRCDLNLFLVFDTIYTERNLTQAARTLDITQPAVSNALARLRKLFDDELFIRTARGMQPTPVADNVAHNVSAALGLLKGSLLERQNFDPLQTERVFQFSMSDLAEALVLPRLMPLIESSAPHLTLQSYYVKRQELARNLARGEVDFAVEVPLVDDPQLCHHSLISDDYVCVLRHGHPALQEAFTLDAFLALQHVHVSSRRKGMGQVDLALLKLDVERRIRLRVQHYRVAAAIVGSTDLALSMPRFLAERYDLAILPLPFPVPQLNFHLYWHRQADSDSAHRWMRESLIRLFET
ncbi:MAG: LysR family transcriptional regulator [Pseudomonadales bacterium]|nr:LysR family transcriptional regulator [Pseudomonadales bacterium]MCP5359026.1 LysR family transcriptional regulator [Pseudomonadales bacterium]